MKALNNMLTEKEVINQAIRRLVNREAFNRKEETDILDVRTKVLLSDALTDFVELAIKKYIKGQQEHGGKITDKDLHMEMGQEITDLFFYWKGMEWKKDNML